MVLAVVLATPLARPLLVGNGESVVLVVFLATPLARPILTNTKPK